MAKQPRRANIDAWTLDQLAKSAFFHRKLHEWKLLDVAMTERARQDLSINTNTVTLIFTAEGIVEGEDEREKFFSAMGI